MAKINQAGMKMKGMESFAPLSGPKKMTPQQIAKRKRSTLSNAADKMFNQKVSK